MATEDVKGPRWHAGPRDAVLTIGIPTWNRADKLIRLLRAIESELGNSDLTSRVVVLVSDNASQDDTQSAVAEFKSASFDLRYQRQTENMGFDGNVRFIYGKVTTPYLWLMADDDLPLKGAIHKVVSVLEQQAPDVLLFSFIQPPGSTKRLFDLPTAVEMVTAPASAIDYVLRCPKISLFIIRHATFSLRDWEDVNLYGGGGWTHVALALSVLSVSENARLAIVSEPLATCDEDYLRIRWSPAVFLNLSQLARHPFIRAHQPWLGAYYDYEGYYQTLQFTFAAKTGGLVPEHPEEYNTFIRDLKFRGWALLRRPKRLIQFVALKTRLTVVWPSVRRFLA